jgi:hypothetical protein
MKGALFWILSPYAPDSVVLRTKVFLAAFVAASRIRTKQRQRGQNGFRPQKILIGSPSVHPCSKSSRLALALFVVAFDVESVTARDSMTGGTFPLSSAFRTLLHERPHVL